MIDPNHYTIQHIELEVADLDIDDNLKDVILATLERYEALKAKLAELEKQEPVLRLNAIGGGMQWNPNYKGDRSGEFYAMQVHQSPAIPKTETTNKRIGDIHIGGEILPEFQP